MIVGVVNAAIIFVQVAVVLFHGIFLLPQHHIVAAVDEVIVAVANSL